MVENDKHYAGQRGACVLRVNSIGDQHAFQLA